MSIFNRAKFKTNTHKNSFRQVFNTLKEFLSEGEDVPNLYDGNNVLDSQDFEKITTVNIETMEKELDNYFEELLGNKNKRVKKKLLKRPFSKKVVYTVNINTENGMKVAKLKIDLKYRNNQLKHMNLRLKTKDAKEGSIKINYKAKPSSVKEQDLYKER